MRRLVVLLIALWLGMHIGFGYVAAPALFQHLERMLAGNIAGELFHFSNWLGLVVWAMAFVVCHQEKRRSYYRRMRVHYTVVAVWVLLAFNEFLMTPVIVALKSGNDHWFHEWIGGGFGMWHGMSSVIHLIVSLLGVILCVLLLRWRDISR